MVAYEHVQTPRFRELIFVFCVSVVTSILAWFFGLVFLESYSLIAFTVLATVFLNFVVYLTKKTGFATILLFLVGILTFSLRDIGVSGFTKILALTLVGVIFEIVFLILKFEIHNVPFDMVIGSILSMAALPVITSFLVSANLASSFPLSLVNISLVSAAVALITSVITFLVWYNIRNTRPIVKLEAYLADLA